MPIILALRAKMVVLLSSRPVWATKLITVSLKQTKIRFMLGVEGHTPTFNPSTQEAEEGRSL